MHDVAHVAEGQAAECVVKDFSYLKFVEFHLAFKNAVEIRLDEIKN